MRLHERENGAFRWFVSRKVLRANRQWFATVVSSVCRAATCVLWSTHGAAGGTIFFAAGLSASQRDASFDRLRGNDDFADRRAQPPWPRAAGRRRLRRSALTGRSLAATLV